MVLKVLLSIMIWTIFKTQQKVKIKLNFPIYIYDLFFPFLLFGFNFLPYFSLLKSSCFYFGQYLVSKFNYYKSRVTSIIPFTIKLFNLGYPKYHIFRHSVFHCILKNGIQEMWILRNQNVFGFLVKIMLTIIITAKLEIPSFYNIRILKLRIIMILKMLFNEKWVSQHTINCQGNQTNKILCIFPASYLCHCILFKVFIKL